MKKIIITGNVGRDPESRADQAGNSYTTFSVGVSVGTKTNPKTDWVEISCNAKLGDLARNYVKKGTKILVEGFPTATAYINKENKPVASLRIYANNFEFLSRREDQAGDESHSNQHEDVYNLPEAGNSSATNTLQSDDIPF